jgi:hypothetical protein
MPRHSVRAVGWGVLEGEGRCLDCILMHLAKRCMVNQRETVRAVEEAERKYGEQEISPSEDGGVGGFDGDYRRVEGEGTEL